MTLGDTSSNNDKDNGAEGSAPSTPAQYITTGPIDAGEKNRTQPLEVSVDTNVEKAMKILKRKLIKEGLFKELKSRRYYEKPSDRKKRKQKESRKKLRKEEARIKKNPYQ